MEDLRGDTQELAAKPTTEAEPGKNVVGSDDSDQAVNARLEAAKDYTWVCVPNKETGLIKVGELHTCSGELFLEWLYWICPPYKENNYSLDDVADPTFREKILFNVMMMQKKMSVALEGKMGTASSKPTGSK